MDPERLIWCCDRFCEDPIPYRPFRDRMIGRGCVCGGTYRQFSLVAGAEIERLRAELERANLGKKAAEHLIRAATGPEDGPTSWRDTANQWLDEFGTFTLTESQES